MESLLAGVSNGNTCEFAEDNSQGKSQPRMKEEAGRLQRRLRNLKGLLTKDVTACIDKIRHFKTKYPDNSTEITTVQIDYVEDITDNLMRCQTRFTDIKKVIEELRMLLCDIWEGEDNELDKALEKLNQDLVLQENKVKKIKRENEEIFNMLSTSKPKESRKSNTGAGMFHRRII